MEQGDESMIKPEDFYTPNELPNKQSTNAMWQSIRRSSSRDRTEPMLVKDRRSFLYGMAATVLLGLALVGAWTIARQTFENSQPQPLRLEQAYVSAIHEFERVMPSVNVNTVQYSRGAGQLSQRHAQLRLVDAAITELRRQTNGTDLSPLKRERLRDLYSKKLQILQQMIEEGEIEL
jgi:hypothetical protein